MPFEIYDSPGLLQSSHFTPTIFASAPRSHPFASFVSVSVSSSPSMAEEVFGRPSVSPSCDWGLRVGQCKCRDRQC